MTPAKGWWIAHGDPRSGQRVLPCADWGPETAMESPHPYQGDFSSDRLVSGQMPEFTRPELQVNRQYYLDMSSADRLVEQFIDRGLPL